MRTVANWMVSSAKSWTLERTPDQAGALVEAIVRPAPSGRGSDVLM
ncbi:MAG: hypothetical protein JO321_12830 [Solirubrobacterales bacterium]|nr:hypothetical protein [Solirubrobacterales bacterium]MBV9536287.1 hypothetical protein [Solirubrobacterales bacterium]